MTKKLYGKKLIGSLFASLLIVVVLAVQIIPHVGTKAYAADQATVYVGLPTDATPLTDFFVQLNTPTTTLGLYLDVGSININGFDIKVTTTGNLIFKQVDDVADGQLFTTKVFSDVTQAGHTLRYTKVSTNTGGIIKGTLHIGDIVFTTPKTPGTGTVAFDAVMVTAPAFTNGLSVTKIPMNYNAESLDKVTPTLPPGVFPSSTPIPTGTPIPTNTPVPTPTIDPRHSQFVFTLILPGIGGTGNKNPIYIQRPIKVEVFDRTNKLIATKDGIINFDATAGNYGGTIDMGDKLTNGPYTVKVSVARYLRKLIAGIQDVVPGSTYQLPETTLEVGDINGDNVIDIKDYNLYVSCFNTKQDSGTCGNNRVLADLNDDGRNDTPTDLTDYKLLFASFANQKGD